MKSITITDCLLGKINETKMRLIESLINDASYLEVEVSGESMEPCLFHGDVVIIVPLLEAPREGDIVLFYDDYYQLALHRFVGTQGENFVLLGDNADFEDFVSQKKVIGKMLQGEACPCEFERADKEISATLDSVKIKVSTSRGRLTKVEMEVV